MIEVKGLNKSFGENHILHDIDTTFEKGKVNLVIGQSGQGKSVLTKLRWLNAVALIVVINRGWAALFWLVSLS